MSFLNLLIICFFFGIHSPNILEARIYFLHVPKTGGTTLRLLLEQQLSIEEVYPFQISQSAVRPVEGELVSGHFPYWFCKSVDNDFEKAFKVTILRDPVERYLSFLRAKAKADTTMSGLESVLKLRKSRNNKYKDGLIDNALCRYLADNPLLEGEALLKSAEETLQLMDCVIFFDQFRDDVIALFKRLGVDLDLNDIPKINTTNKGPVPAQVLKEVRRLNEWDIKLYNYAKTYLFSKNTSYPLRTTSFANLLKTTEVIDYTFNLPLNGRGWTYRDTSSLGNGKHKVYRWVMEYPAERCFCIESGYNYVLSFTAFPLTDEVIPRVDVNGKEIEICRHTNETFSLYKGKITEDLITENPTKITFHSTKSYQYRDIYPSKYNRNHPPLSFAVERIQISKQD